MNAVAALTSLTASYAWSIAQITLFAAAALVIYSLARRQPSRQNVLLLAASLAIAAVLTLSFLSPWPNWNLGNQWAEWSTTQSPDFRVAHFERQTTTTTPLITAGSDVAQESTITKTVPVLVPIDYERSHATAPAAPRTWLRIALAAFALLTLVGILRFIVGLWAVHRHRQSSTLIRDYELEREFDSLARQFKITRSVALRVAPSLTIPATIGWRNPLVLVPPCFCKWSPNERRAVLAHELAHVAESHYPLWLVGQFAVAANFYHPLVHWFGRRLRLEQELAADALALEVFADRRAYANILASLALAPSRSHAVTASLGLYMSRPLLMRRIAMLRDPDRDRRQPQRFSNATAYSLLALVALFALGLRITPQATAADEPAPAPPQTKIGIETVNSTTAILQLPGEPTIDQVRTQADLLKSLSAIQAALNEPEVAQLPILKSQANPAAWVHDHLDVGLIPNSDVFYVRMQDAGPEIDQLRKIVNAIVRTHLEISTTDARKVVRDALARSYERLCTEIQDKTEAQRRLAEELGFSTSKPRDPETELLMRELAEAVKARAELELKLAELQTQFMIMEQQLNDPAAFDGLVDQQLIDNPNIHMMNQELMELQYRLNALATESKSGRSKEADRLQQQITAKQQQIAQYKAQLKLQLQTKLSGHEKRDSKQYPMPKLRVPDDSTSQLRSIRKEFQIRAGVLRKQLATLNKSITDKKETLTAKSQVSVELEVGAAELEHLETIAADMAIKLEMLRVESASLRVRVIQWAM